MGVKYIYGYTMKLLRDIIPKGTTKTALMVLTFSSYKLHAYHIK